jgi:hypothetical protein
MSDANGKDARQEDQIGEDGSIFEGGNFYVRIRGSAEAASQAIRILHDADPTLPVAFRTLDGQVNRSLNLERMLAALSTSFGTLDRNRSTAPIKMVRGATSSFGMRIRYLLVLFAGAATLLCWVSVFAAAYLRRNRSNVCHCCHSVRIRRSWPKLVDKILGYCAITPRRCEACLKRFYVPKSRVAVAGPAKAGGSESPGQSDPINLTEERLLNPANTLNKYVYGGNNPRYRCE